MERPGRRYGGNDGRAFRDQSKVVGVLGVAGLVGIVQALVVRLRGRIGVDRRELHRLGHAKEWMAEEGWCDEFSSRR